MPTHSLKARALTLCLTLWLPVTAAVYAGGQPEARLAEVEKLVQQQDYSAALKLLAAIQRSDPNLRDETSRLMAQIMAVTLRYNAVLEDLSKAIEAGDTDKMQALIPELRRIDPARAAGMTGQTEVLIGFLKLLQSAQALLNDGRTADALGLYLLPFVDPGKAGVTLPSSLFEAAGYGEIITASVKRDIASIITTTQEQLKSAPSLAAVLPAVKALLALPSSSGTAAQDRAAQFDAIARPLLQAAAAEGSVRSGASSIAEISRSIQVSSDKAREDLFLRYVLWLCLGRETKTEGILYALRLLWAGEAQQMADAAGAAVTAAFESARSAYESGELAAADAAFQEIPARSILAAKATALVSARFSMNAASGWKLSDADSPALKDALGRALSAQEYAAEAGGYRLLIAYRNDLDAMPAVPAGLSAADVSSASLTAEAALLASARTSLERRTIDARSQDDMWTAQGKLWGSRVEAIEAAAPLAESARHMASLFRTFADADLRSRDLAYALRIAAIGGAAFPKRLDDAVNMRKKAEDLKDGTVKHPDQALLVLAATASTLDLLIVDIVAHEQKLQADKDYVKSTPEFSALFEGTAAQPGYNAILQSARTERAQIDALVADAQSQKDAADAALIEGDKLFNDAQQAYASGDTKAATDNLNKSLVAYQASLKKEYTEQAAARTTKDFDELAAKINKLNLATITAGAQKNEADIRALINKPDYPAAKDRLDAALAAWPSNLGTYQPYIDLQQQIQNGLAATQGLTFDRRDPRAEVVNAFLNASQVNLTALKLNEAAQNVADALTVAPNYGAARVLELKIRRQTDPDAFKKEAAAQITAYRKIATESTDRNELNGVYLALLSYSSLDATFKAQLASLIQELRYKLNLDPRPATPQQIAQADALLRQARTIAQQGTDQSFDEALALIAQVSVIVPLYPPARTLSQQIAAQRVAATPDQLSAAAQQRYNQAWSLYLSGAYPDAYKIVQDLWNNSKNQPYVPLQQLKKRLEVALQL